MLGRCEFESSGSSQAVRRLEEMCLILAERPADSGLLLISHRSPSSVFCHFGGENAESLRPQAGLFPFSGDRDRRPGSIYTAWRTWERLVRELDAPFDANRTVAVNGRRVDGIRYQSSRNQAKTSLVLFADQENLVLRKQEQPALYHLSRDRWLALSKPPSRR